MHHIKTAHSTRPTPEEAVEELRHQLSDSPVHTLIYFASSFYDQDILSRSVRNAFPDSTLLGCSTAGELISGRMMTHSLVAMAFHPKTLTDIRVEVVEDLRSATGVLQAFKAFEEHFGQAMDDMDHREYLGIVLIDGMSRAEERLLDRIGDLTNVTFIGGSAGDDFRLERTFVHAEGKAYAGAAVLALIKPGVPFDFIKTQSFKTLGCTLTPTRSDEETREVFEFDGKPASLAYAEALGETVETAGGRFMTNPLGLMVYGSPYVRSPQQIKGDRMVFFCSMTEGMEMEILESTDIIRETEKAVMDKGREMGGIGAIINFNCILRTLDLEKKGLTQAYADIFSKIPTIGFSTYGEAFIGHINQTATMLVFG